MFRKKNTYRTIILLAAGLILLLFLLLLFSKNTIFKNKLTNKINKIESRENVQIHYSAVELKGITQIILQDLSVQKESDTILFINQLKVELNIRYLFYKQLKAKSIEFDQASINLNNNSLDTLTVSEKDKSTGSSELNRLLINAMNRLHRSLPDKLLFNSLMVKSDAIQYGVIELSSFDLHYNSIETDLSYSYRHEIKHCHILSKLKTGKHKLDIEVYSDNEYNLVFPSLNQAEIYLEKLRFNLSFKKLKKNNVQIIFKLDDTKARFYHERINSDPVKVDHFSISQVFLFTKNFLKTKSSTIRLNDVSIHPEFNIGFNPKSVEFGLDEKKINISQLIHSIPDDCFNYLGNVKAKGYIDYRFLFSLQLDYPDSLLLESEIKSTDFVVTDFGKLDFAGLNDSFEHIPFNSTDNYCPVLLSNENPHYKTLDEISPLLKAAVLYSEDGLFYYHKGFILSAIREALIEDVKEKAFVRGGSTISQQLVKNLYLENDKVLSRKLEEIVITWLLENYGQVSKDRLFEIYLNIIEWGPGIYGASKASLFYFRKDVKDLSLSEAIFMAAIIPRPKKYQYAFNKEGKLHDYFAPHYRIVAERMLKHEIISLEQFDKLNPNVELKGAARNRLKPFNLVPLDSIQ